MFIATVQYFTQKLLISVLSFSADSWNLLMTSFFFFLTVLCHPLLSPFVLSSTTFTFFFSASTCPLIGEHLRICPQGYTCCTSNVEDKLASQSRTEVENVIKDAGRSLQISLTGQYKIFDGELFVFMMQSICLCILFFSF